MTAPSILRPDDFDLGMFLSVLNGDCCEAGCCERYRQLKGMPLMLMDVNLPYIVCQLPGGVCVPIDVRECDLVRVSESYAGWFGMWKSSEQNGGNQA